MAKIVKSIAGRYEVRKVEFGKVYRWCPEYVVVECDCGEIANLTRSATTCECGADHGPIVIGGLAAGRSGDVAIHPWRYTMNRRDARIPY